jgi:toxin ParE1/3/4
MNVEWSDRALRRIDEIADHIAMDDPTAAERWVTELFSTEIEDDEVREIIYGAYRVFYQVSDVVEVLTVRHGSQLVREDEVGREQI